MSLCFTCGIREAGNEHGGPYSAYCAGCQPKRPESPRGTAEAWCSACGQRFPSDTAFDMHLAECRGNGPIPEVKRQRRRTSAVTIGPDTVEVCEPECRNGVLVDIGLPGRGGGWRFAPHGEATVTVGWSGKTYHVEWHRRRANARPCDLCAGDWRYRIPRLVATARARSAAMADDLAFTANLRPYAA